jgi:hypothetical protein
MATNLPNQIIEDSGAATRLYFDTYGEAALEFSAVDVDVTVAFFTSVGFDRDAAEVTAMTVLRQAKIDGTPIAQILDTIKGFDKNQLSQLVGEILNNNRVATSTLGFRINDVLPNQTRQISA